MPNRYAAFISYARRYAPWVTILQENLEAYLKAAGREEEVFLDETDLRSGRSWVTQLQEALGQSEHFILIATPEALATPRVGDEWTSFIATRRDWLEQGRFHIVYLVEVPLPPFLQGIERVGFIGASETKYRGGLEKLVGGLLGTKERRNPLEHPDDIDIKIPSVPHPGLDPKLRSSLIEWLEPVLGNDIHRFAVAGKFGIGAERLEGQPSAALLASAFLVSQTGDEEPQSAAVRIVDTLLELFQSETTSRTAQLATLREKIIAGRKEHPESDLISIWMTQVVADHKRLVPYFQQQAEADLLARVYVELAVRSGGEISPSSKSRNESELPKADQPLGLLEVLRLPKEGNPSISGRWLVLGDPGSGKTTLLRHLTAELASQGSDRPWVPLFESLPKLMGEGRSLTDRVVRRLERAGHPSQGLAAALDRKGKEGRLLLLLDGLDEVSHDEKEDAERLLRDLAIRWPDTPIVVTSRPIGYRRPGGDYRELRLLPLDRVRRREFLARWLGRETGKPDEERAEAALAALESPELSDLAGNPLYLTLMALLFEQDTEPARYRTNLYDQVFNLLLEGRHRSDGRPIDAQEAVKALLRHLAVGMTEDNLDAEPVSRLEDRLYRLEAKDVCEPIERISRWRGKMRQFLDELSEQTGILGPHDGLDANWRFWHRTFREALTAEFLEIEWRDREGKGKAKVLARAARVTAEECLNAWGEPFALLAGRVKDSDELVRDLVKENRALGLRAIATAQSLRAATLRDSLGLTGKWEDRVDIYQRITEISGDPLRAPALLDQLRRITTNGNDLFFLDRVIREIGNRFGELAGAADDLISRLYDHISAPPEELFRWIETPDDGRIPLWRKIPGWEVNEKNSESRRGEVHRFRTRIEKPFALGAVPITNAQYVAFDPGHKVQAKRGMREEDLPFQPVTNVTWYEAVSFCRWLATCFPWAKGARLPLEEEWEYACRVGSKADPDSALVAAAQFTQVGWFGRNSGKRIQRVAGGEANPWGLYDFDGNLWEWTSTSSEDVSEERTTVKSPVSPATKGLGTSDKGRVVRRGSTSLDGALAAIDRYIRTPDFIFETIGFRVALQGVPNAWELRPGAT